MRLVPACLLALSLATFAPAGAQPQKLAYPPATKGDIVDDVAGHKVADPYRWMEDLDSPAVKQWVDAENKVTFGYLGQLPQREAIRKRLTELWNYPRTEVPSREAGQIWFRANTGLQRQSVLFRQASMTGQPVEVLDPNKLSPDGSVAVAMLSVSPDGHWLAYTTAQGGSDLQDIHVRDLTTGKDLGETIPRVKFTGISWTKDSKGFLYSRFKGTEKSADLQHANQFHQAWHHVVGSGTPDRLIFERPDQPGEGVGADVSDDGRWLFLTASSGTSGNRLWIADLGSPKKPDLAAKPSVVAADQDAFYNPLGVADGRLYLYTTDRAPNGRIVAAPVGDSARAHWVDIVPEGKNPISDSKLLKGRLAVVYLVDVQSKVELFGLDGTPQGEVALPEAGSVSGLRGKNEGTEFFFQFTSYLRPRTAYRYDLEAGKIEPFHPPKSPFDASQYETRALFYTSKDGTRVPLFVTMKKGIALDGSHPTILYGYGGFDVNIVPAYSPAVAGWLDLGGIWAVANLRGGGEYGENWHHAGWHEKKQNVFDDFIAAGEYLIHEGYTTSSRLAIEGGSNGGLLVGAVADERPDLCAVALPAVGVMDMLRYQRFTGGSFWVEEYGSADNPAQFDWVYAYSPLHNIKPGTCYPATLATTADHDDRVVPSHSFKYMATLQAAQGCDRPVLIRVETAGSHGYRPTDKLIAEVADEYAFALANMEPAGK